MTMSSDNIMVYYLSVSVLYHEFTVVDSQKLKTMGWCCLELIIDCTSL